MPDETKSPAPPPTGEPKGPPGAPNPPSVEPVPAKKPNDPAAVTNPGAAPNKSAGSSSTSPAPAASHEPHAAPAKPAGPASVPWNSEMTSRLKQRYGSGLETSTYLGQNYMLAESSIVAELLRVLRDEEQFDYCVDVTAVHYPEREKQFELIWILYSFAANERIRVKAFLAEGESAPSVTSIWAATNWLEREVYDMFGITFEGHPDMKRILLPDGWKGHPLRKDYGIIQQDQEWVKINLGIESGQ
jgi:NADH-quinone oxidoreductase subunit C